MVRLESTVNSVNVVTEVGFQRVEKKYFDKAIGTGIAVHLARYQIEDRTLKLLASVEHGKRLVWVPEVLSRDDGIPQLIIEFVAGERLGLHLRKNVLAPNLLSALGIWLRTAEVFLYERRVELFLDLWETQQNVSSMLAKLKGNFEDYMNPSSAELSVSLGDVGLNNILYAEESLCVLDFEFAHVAPSGRDVGQLSAALGAFGVGETLVNSYVEAGGSLTQVRAWQRCFNKYYLGKK